jgi:hypothetical protein
MPERVLLLYQAELQRVSISDEDDAQRWWLTSWIKANVFLLLCLK